MKQTILFICCLIASAVSAQEKHLKNIRQLTFGGDNAEAYFSPNGQMLTMQVTNPSAGIACDQIFFLNLHPISNQPSSLKLISKSGGRTTCSFFMPDGKHILYASTHRESIECPPPPKPRTDGKYVWPIYSSFDIFVADLDGNIVKQLTDTPGYDAEAVVSPDGKKIAFTSMRSGDLEVWTMDIDGKNLKQITFDIGYDGGSFFSHDSKQLVFRSSRPTTPEEIEEYKDLLKQDLVTPTQMEIYVCDVDGSNLRQVTHLGKANWSPYFTPDDKRIIFSSNHHAKRGYDFQLYTVDLKGEKVEQITYESIFNAFPMFSPDGKKIVFSSNRQGVRHETNVFIADWVETDPAEYASSTILKNHISFLASDALKGRLAGSKEEKKAAKFVSKQFTLNMLKPYKSKNFLHPFTYNHKINPHSDEPGKENVKANNVVGFLNNGASKTIVIGAHYDHLGLNERNHSTQPNSKGQIHNGADDNASGVAGMLELVRMFSTNKTVEPFNVLFIAFSGEEDGLMGSGAFVEKIHPSDSIVCMINLDMIGRLDSMSNLSVSGVGTSPAFGKIIEQFKPAGIAVAIDSSGFGPSDYTSFYKKNIPVLAFFTGLHKEYHKPTDDQELINYEGLKKIADFVFNMANVVGRENTLPFLKTKTKANRTVSKYKVTLGIMPDYGDYSDGMHITGIIDGRPGQRAGLAAGDVITQLNDCTIKDIYSYMDCLSKFSEGDEVMITFIREGKKETVKAKF